MKTGDASHVGYVLIATALCNTGLIPPAILLDLLFGLGEEEVATIDDEIDLVELFSKVD